MLDRATFPGPAIIGDAGTAELAKAFEVNRTLKQACFAYDTSHNDCQGTKWLY